MSILYNRRKEFLIKELEERLAESKSFSVQLKYYYYNILEHIENAEAEIYSLENKEFAKNEKILFTKKLDDLVCYLSHNWTNIT